MELLHFIYHHSEQGGQGFLTAKDVSIAIVSHTFNKQVNKHFHPNIQHIAAAGFD